LDSPRAKLTTGLRAASVRVFVQLLLVVSCLASRSDRLACRYFILQVRGCFILFGWSGVQGLFNPNEGEKVHWCSARLQMNSSADPCAMLQIKYIVIVRTKASGPDVDSSTTK
jgi:hypothetical protein